MNVEDHRRLLRKKRRALSSTEQDKAAQGILDNVCQHRVLEQAGRVAIYLANDGEINPMRIYSYFHGQSINWFLPRLPLDGSRIMEFAELKNNTEMLPNRFGILEPSANGSSGNPASSMDVIFMPLVGFDRNGNRLGRGGGYYDSTLSLIPSNCSSNPLLVGLGHHFQENEQFHPQGWDVQLQTIITDQEFICVKQK